MTTGERENGGKKKRGLVEEHVWRTMVMDSRVGTDWGSSARGMWGESNRRKTETTVIEQGPIEKINKKWLAIYFVFLPKPKPDCL